MNFPILKNENEIIQLLKQHITPTSKDFLCFFSSQLQAYITNPIFFSIPLEDKIVHRGYAVFETTKIFQNKIYQLDKHIERFNKSINYINLKSNYSSEQYKEILTKLASIARNIEPDLNTDIELRYYYSAGLGNFSLVVNNEMNTFYAVAFRCNNSIRPVGGTNEQLVETHKIKESIAKSKNTNYLINAIVTKISKENGGHLGVMVDEEGHLLESPVSNIAFVTKNGEFNIPPFDKTLIGTTIVRCMKYAEEELIPNKILTGISREYMHVDSFLDKITEMMLVGGDFVIPILNINNQPVNDGKVGPVTKFLQDFLLSDKKGEEASETVPIL